MEKKLWKKNMTLKKEKEKKIIGLLLSKYLKFWNTKDKTKHHTKEEKTSE